MTNLLRKAGESFLRAFVGGIIIAAPGVLAATNLDQAYALGVAALAASLAAGFKAVQVFVPQISWASVIDNPVYASWADSFSRAFLGTFLTLWIGILNAPNPDVSKAAIWAVLVGAVTAGLRALQGFATKGESPAPAKGLDA